MITVAKEGGDFSTIQEAVLSLKDGSGHRQTIFVKDGVYEEKLFIRKESLDIVGESREKTMIRYNDGAKKLFDDGAEYGTFNSATLFLSGNDITMRNITVENYAGPGRQAGQALAVFVSADRAAFYNCAFLGYQDTVYTGGALGGNHSRVRLPDYIRNSDVRSDFPVLRNYFENCLICGDVDFIFGPNTVYYNKCHIFVRSLPIERSTYITAANTPIGQEYGFVFHGCKVEFENTADCNSYLGRPWRDYAKTAFVKCEIGEGIHPAGWHNWSKPKAEVTCGYVEYMNYGAGADTSERAAFAKILDNPGIYEYYSVESVLAGDDGWNPQENKNAEKEI